MAIANIVSLQRIVLTGNFVDVPYVASTLEKYARNATDNKVPIVHQAYAMCFVPILSTADASTEMPQ
jgi:hypothetical protein